MSKYYAQDDILLLANGATNCIVRNAAMPITLRGGERPEGFPLPIKRVRGEGDITQEYRPLAILEWIQDMVSGEVARRTAAKKAKHERCNEVIAECVGTIANIEGRS